MAHRSIRESAHLAAATEHAYRCEGRRAGTWLAAYVVPADIVATTRNLLVCLHVPQLPVWFAPTAGLLLLVDLLGPTTIRRITRRFTVQRPGRRHTDVLGPLLLRLPLAAIAASELCRWLPGWTSAVTGVGLWLLDLLVARLGRGAVNYQHRWAQFRNPAPQERWEM